MMRLNREGVQGDLYIICIFISCVFTTYTMWTPNMVHCLVVDTIYPYIYLLRTQYDCMYVYLYSYSYSIQKLLSFPCNGFFPPHFNIYSTVFHAINSLIIFIKLQIYECIPSQYSLKIFNNIDDRDLPRTYD
jgi:hypothetical protein